MRGHGEGAKRAGKSDEGALVEDLSEDRGGNVSFSALVEDRHDILGHRPAVASIEQRRCWREEYCNRRERFGGHFGGVYRITSLKCCVETVLWEKISSKSTLLADDVGG